MMKQNMFLITCILGVSLAGSGYAQENSKVAFTDNDSVKVLKEQNYAGSGLWGYMNGGADLYLEYGVHALLVQEITWKELPLKAEIFHMKGEEHAFGIFSVQAGDKYTSNEFGYSSENAWQFQAAIGEYYISLVNTSGGAAHAALTAEAGLWFMQQFGTGPLLIPPMPPAGKGFGPVRHARGMLGMRAACAEINPLFRELEGYTLWLRVNHKTRDIVARFEAPVAIMNYVQVKARVMDTPLGDIYVTEFNRLDTNTALFKCQYRDKSKD